MRIPTALFSKVDLLVPRSLLKFFKLSFTDFIIIEWKPYEYFF